MRRVLIIATILAPSIASAHIALMYPTPRTTELKGRVCGVLNNTTRANVTTLKPGATITVMWKETIEHPGHYRISFDGDGQDFSVPPDYNSDTKPLDPNVIMDLVPDIQGGFPAGGRLYSQQITLPNMECANCTLQVIQMMTDKPPYTTDTASNDIYYQCADLILSNGAPAPDAGVGTPDAPPGGGPDAGNGNTGAGGGCSTSGGGGLVVGLAALGLVIRRRRSRSISV